MTANQTGATIEGAKPAPPGPGALHEALTTALTAFQTYLAPHTVGNAELQALEANAESAAATLTAFRDLEATLAAAVDELRGLHDGADLDLRGCPARAVIEYFTGTLDPAGTPNSSNRGSAMTHNDTRWAP